MTARRAALVAQLGAHADAALGEIVALVFRGGWGVPAGGVVTGSGETVPSGGTHVYAEPERSGTDLGGGNPK